MTSPGLVPQPNPSEVRFSVSMWSLRSFGVRDGLAVMITGSPYFSVVRVTPCPFNCPTPPHSIDQRTMFQQKFDELRIAGARCAQQGGCPLRQHPVAAAILRHITIGRPALELNIRIGAGFEQQVDLERVPVGFDPVDRLAGVGAVA